MTVICLFSSKVGRYCGAFLDMIQPLFPTGRNTPSSSGTVTLLSRSWAARLAGSGVHSLQVAPIDVFAGCGQRRDYLAAPDQEIDRRLHRLVRDLALRREGAALLHQYRVGVLRFAGLGL